MKKILTVEQVTKTFGSGSVAVNALAGITFDVEKGQFVAVMGPSGSGKSTLLNVISTIEPPTAGNITVDGQPITGCGDNEIAVFRRDKLGFIFQEYNLLDTLTVAENIVLPLNLKKVGPAETAKRLADIAEKLGVTDQLKKYPYELSVGQRQRVACARAVIADPAIVLADEPTGALDSKNSRNLMELFTKMNRELGSTILMVTHDATVASYADRVIFLSDGTIHTEIYRGERSRADFRHEIIQITEALGVDCNAD